MSHGLEKKRQDAGGYPTEGYPPPGVVVNRVRSLLRTWSQFGTGGEDNMIAELHEALGTDANR
ncbi:hypothetical protein [Rhodococcus sp. LW-XY12]|uniref:hypothetical protein n=1 Tax=Rhodococcus sp. LW-XY12 TaxID=2856851 RepID=UPI001C56E796|nr:hypothetical protein [Rhodococcus sp. LW-XY12]QXU53648.1 hypothetical protein KXC42_23475 [Rhodococcus sp. LW-XY12]